MRQNQRIKVEDEKNAVEFVDCDSSDIEQSSTLRRLSSVSRVYLHEQVIRVRPKTLVLEIQPETETKDGNFYCYQVCKNPLSELQPGFVLSKKKLVGSHTTVNSTPINTGDKLIYLSCKML